MEKIECCRGVVLIDKGEYANLTRKAAFLDLILEARKKTWSLNMDRIVDAVISYLSEIETEDAEC